MPYPSIKQFENGIRDNTLFIGKQIVDHPAFLTLLNALKQEHLAFASPSVSYEDGTNNITIEGESFFFSDALSKADLYLYETPETDVQYEFEWHGTLPATSFSTLYKNAIIVPDPMNVVTEIMNGVFNEVDLLYTSHDEAFAIEVNSSDIKFEIPEVGFSLDKIGFYYERSLGHKIKTIYRLYSIIKIGSTTIPTQIELPAGNNIDHVCWSLKTTDIIILNDGLKDIINFLSGQQDLNAALGKDILTLLPEAVNTIPQFALTDFVIHFNPQTKFLQLLDFSIQSVKSFELIPGFLLKDIGVSALITFLDNRVSCTLGLFGRLVFSELIEAGISIRLPFNLKEDWKIAMDGSIDLEKLSDLETLPFIKLKDLNIPPEWLTVNNIHLDNLNIVFNPAEAKIKTVAFSLQVNTESSLIPGLKVKDPYLEFNLTLN
jgi:hypothetical protein